MGRAGIRDRDDRFSGLCVYHVSPAYETGFLGKSRAMLRFASLVVIPIILYSLFFFALVGFEELTHISVVPEGLARTFPILVGFGFTIWIVSTLAFGAALVFIKKQPPSPDTRAERTP